MAGDATISAVGFAGSGTVDDVLITTFDPTQTVVDFTLVLVDTTPSGFAGAVKFTTSASGELTFEGAPLQGFSYGSSDPVTMSYTLNSGYTASWSNGTTATGAETFVPVAGTTYTLTVSQDTPAYPTYIDSTDTYVTGKYTTWKTAYQADTESAYETAFLLNMDPTATVTPGTALLKIAAITEVSGGWELEIASDATTLTAEDGTTHVGNGYLAITYAADLATLTGSSATTQYIPVAVDSQTGKITVTVTAAGAKFMKAELTTTAPAQN